MVVPISRGGRFARLAGFAVPLGKEGLKASGLVRRDQPRALDLVARGGRFLEAAPEAVVAEVLARVAALFD